MGERCMMLLHNVIPIRIEGYGPSIDWQKDTDQGQLTPKCQNVFMQISLPLTRPRLKSRRIARDSCKVAIMKPINNFILLAQPGPTLRIIRAMDMGSQPQDCALILRLRVIRLDEAGPHEQDIPDLDVAAL
jgi:hypothetical protein